MECQIEMASYTNLDHFKYTPYSQVLIAKQNLLQSYISAQPKSLSLSVPYITVLCTYCIASNFLWRDLNNHIISNILQFHNCFTICTKLL